MYETRKHSPLYLVFVSSSVSYFPLRVQRVSCWVPSLSVWTGYGYFKNLAWRDAFLNSAMLLGGMGPVDAPKTDSGKVFAGLYALYAGLVFIVVAGHVFAPVLHRLLHKFHWDEGN